MQFFEDEETKSGIGAHSVVLEDSPGSWAWLLGASRLRVGCCKSTNGNYAFRLATLTAHSHRWSLGPRNGRIWTIKWESLTEFVLESTPRSIYPLTPLKSLSGAELPLTFCIPFSCGFCTAVVFICHFINYLSSFHHKVRWHVRCWLLN